MIRYPYPLAEAAQSSMQDPMTWISIGLCSAGAVILLVWALRWRTGDPLKNSPERRNILPFWFAPAQILFWVFALSLTAMMINRIIPESEAVRRELALHLVNLALDVLIIMVILGTAYFGFARRLKGFGLDFKTLPGDLKWAAVNLLAVWPLIEGALLLTLGIGKLINPDFSIEVHQSLTALGEYPQLWMRLVIAVNAVLIVPVFEELVFRGLLQSTLRSHTGSPWAAIGITSVLFSMLHPATHWPAMILLSAGLGYAYEKSGSLLRSICMHILFNGFVVTMTLWLGAGGTS